MSCVRRWTAALCLGLAATAVHAEPGMDATSETKKSRPPLRQTETTYSVVAGLDGEIFPVFANYASMRPAGKRQWGVISVKISNPTQEALRQRITVQVPGWSDQEIQMVETGAGETRTVIFAPTFYPKLYRNREIMAATAVVSVAEMSGKTVFASTAPLRLRSADDMYWGRDFKYASYIASWVMPHDPLVGRVLAKAKEYMPGRRLPGYERRKTPAQQERMTFLQAKAIYRAVQRHGVSYVKSSLTFGGNQHITERVRTPRESLGHASANCIDGVVLYASLFENLGMEPVVVLVPGHAYIGVRVAENSNRYLYLETSVTGTASFETAVRSAVRGIAAVGERDVIRVPIEDARHRGIFPMPTAASLGEDLEVRQQVKRESRQTRPEQ